MFRLREFLACAPSSQSPHAKAAPPASPASADAADGEETLASLPRCCRRVRKRLPEPALAVEAKALLACPPDVSLSLRCFRRLRFAWRRRCVVETSEESALSLQATSPFQARSASALPSLNDKGHSFLETLRDALSKAWLALRRCALKAEDEANLTPTRGGDGGDWLRFCCLYSQLMDAQIRLGNLTAATPTTHFEVGSRRFSNASIFLWEPLSRFRAARRLRPSAAKQL